MLKAIRREEIAITKKVHNMDELAKSLQPTLKEMEKQLTDRVYKTLNHFLYVYYQSYTPSSYQRTKDLLYSATKIEPRVVGNKVVTYVYIDTDSMDHYYNASGKQVATWANQGLHGGLNAGNGTPHVWDDTIQSTVENGELLKLAAEYLRSKGFTVKT